MRKKRKIFYGWILVAGGSVLMATVIGIGWNCFGLFVKPVCADMGFSRQEMSTNMTLLSFAEMFVNLFWGAILRHIPLKRIMKVMAFVFPAAFFGYSLSTELWMFYLCSILVGIGIVCLTTLAFSILLSNWFLERRGQAIGLASMGSGIGGAIFNPIASKLIETVGWRAAYAILAVVILVTTVGVVFFIVKETPEEKGLKPYGWEHRQIDSGVPVAEMEQGQTLGELMHSARFWALGLAVCITTTSIGCLTQCMSPHLTDCGYSASAAAWMVSASMMALAVGKIILGTVYDRLGTRTTTILSGVCGMLGLVGMVLCRVRPLLGFILLGECLGSSFGTVGLPFITQSLFGRRDYSANYGFIAACSSVGSSLSPMINGAVYDHTGSYSPAFIFWSVLLAGAVAIYMRILPKDRRGRKTQAGDGK